MKRFVGLMILVVLTLTGCSALEDKVGDILLTQSGILEDEEYQVYSDLAVNGRLSQEGVIIDESLNEIDIIEEQGPIHVTFGVNQYIDVVYYKNAELTTGIDPASCYIYPGDSIYASVTVNNKYTNMYRADVFQVREYVDDEFVASMDYPISGNLVYTIPEDPGITEISILPIGKYDEREITVRSYYKQDDKTEATLTSAGTWYINKDTLSSDTMKVGPVDRYILKYDFDEENYFFVSSSPECFTNNPNAVGYVVFPQANPWEETADYAVELHTYFKLTISAEKGNTITIKHYVTGEEETTLMEKNGTWESNRLQYGDQIVIEGNCKLLEGDYQNLQVDRDPIGEGYRYTIKIVDEPTENALELIEKVEYVNLILSNEALHGDVVYKLDGEVVSGNIMVLETQQLTLTYTITDSEYKFEEGLWKTMLQWVQDQFGDMSSTVDIPITPDMNGTVLDPDEYVIIVKKGE